MSGKIGRHNYKSNEIKNAGQTIFVQKRGKKVPVKIPSFYIDLRAFRRFYPGLAENIYDRMRCAVELRRQGISYPVIAEQLGVGSFAVQRDVQKWYEVVKSETFESAVQSFQMDMERLDMLLAAVLPGAKEGDEKKIASALNILKRRADMLGLDAPTKIDISKHLQPDLKVINEENIIDLTNEQKRLEAELAEFVK